MAKSIENKLPLSDRLIPLSVYLAGSAVFIGGVVHEIVTNQGTGTCCAVLGAAIVALGYEYQREARDIYSD